MSAQSVTGIGQGMSNGKWKPSNQCGGCDCGCATEETEKTRPKTYCKVNYTTNRTASYRSNSSSVSTSTCA